MQLIVIRHGQTTSNRERRFQGSGRGGGASLTEQGREETRRLASYLTTRFNLDRLYCSPSRRTIETAEILTDQISVPVYIRDEIREIDCGEWGDKSADSIQSTHPELWSQWRDQPLSFHFPNGEDLHAVRARAAAFVEPLAQQFPYQTIALVTHSALISVLLAHLHGWELGTAWSSSRGYHPNAAFSTLNFDAHSHKLLDSTIASTVHLDDKPKIR